MNFNVLQKLVVTTYNRSTNFYICRKIGNICLTSRNIPLIDSRKLIKVHVFETSNAFFHTSLSVDKNKKINSNNNASENISRLQVKNRWLRKKRSLVDNEEQATPGYWSIKALATAEGYNLEKLTYALIEQQLYMPNTINTTTKSLPDVIHAVAKYDVENEHREIFFFREGTIVMWNISELESGNVLQFLKEFEENSYASELVQAESEVMDYTYAEQGKHSCLRDGDIILAPDASSLEKYTFSNAMAQSVKLGIWEASLDKYVDSIKFVTEDLKLGRKLKMTQSDVLRKQGELFALRHLINLSSDLLNTPDFYWERDDLEKLYQRTCAYFDMVKRTKVMNEKLNHCVELVGILATHLSDRHHIRLEWMIIALITVEVVFEVLHYIDRYLVK